MLNEYNYNCIEDEAHEYLMLLRLQEGYTRTFIRRLRHVRQPVFVLRFISFLCLPPDIILPPSVGGRG